MNERELPLQIRVVEDADFDEIYSLGKRTPEIKVSSTSEFMEPDELLWSMRSSLGVFLVAVVDERIVGFIYAHAQDVEKPMPQKFACVTYLVVDKEWRKRGIASKLFLECVPKLKAKGVTNLFSWANVESDGAITEFLKKQGFAEGHRYMWMDKKI